MALAPGTRVGSYDVLAPLGAGGMGEVYRARDARLNRDVALKILPDVFVADPDRVDRFEREARALASLNHPNIGAIYGFEESGGIRALVLELVDGPTLAEYVDGRALTIDEALSIARQICGALEAAHAQGIVHRDLKPANIKLPQNGVVKVLDFGLAKMLDTGAAQSSAVNVTNSPTLATGTRVGVILGTAAYMAPEQARGKIVDKRADIWAFGCVLFELIAGRRPFGSDDVAETLAFIITKEPDWSALPASTPAGIRRMLRRCLAKDPNNRLHDIADARLEIDDVLAGTAERPEIVRVKPRERLVRSAAALALIAVALVAVALLASARWRAAEPLVTRLDIATPPTPDALSFALSPDGRKIVYLANVENGAKLWLRSLDQVTAQPLAGTDDARYPFWSPDSRSVAFFAEGKLKRIDLPGATPQVLADAPSGRGGTWSEVGVIVFAPSTATGLMKVDAHGGAPVAITELVSGQSSHRWPQFLPDGRRLVFTIALGDPAQRGVYATSIEGEPPRRVLATESPTLFVPPDWLLVARDATLVAHRFDPARLTVAAESTLIDQNVGSDLAVARGAISASATIGILAHRNAIAPRRQLAWVDRTGKVASTIWQTDDAAFASPELSPDGRHVAIQRTVQGNLDVWLLDLDRDVVSRFTYDPSADSGPVWTADGSGVIFRSARTGGGDIFIKPADRSAEERPLLTKPENKIPTASRATDVFFCT